MFKTSKCLKFPITNQRKTENVSPECIENVNRILKVTKIKEINAPLKIKCESLDQYGDFFYRKKACDKVKQDFEIAEKMYQNLIEDLAENCSSNNKKS